ncbi:MAG: YbhB/YbcL family Raf kinase inhibitor-like protein [Oligoflexales bacterium]|nr:YbhB/YbcL family Raf kinase inhibitor-like protein [Oligoflexales bacterium]
MRRVLKGSLLFLCSELVFLCSFLSLCSELAGAETFSLKSSSFKQGDTLSQAQVFNGFGCTGKNISPDLQWTKPPEGTKSLALTVYDPDAPTGSGWWHWVVFNMPAGTDHIPAGVLADGQGLAAGTIQGRTDFGQAGYDGPCPPEGDKPHRYQFKIFALKDHIPLDKDASPAMVGFYIHQLRLAEASIEAVYARKPKK